MHKKRVIARIDIKNEFVIKGIHLEGLRKIGNPNEIAKKYYDDGVDEIIFMDAVAAYYDRNSLSEIILRSCQDVFVPITVGGGIRSITDIKQTLNNGADKVAVNSQAVRTPSFISEASKVFGSQCIVVSIEAKRRSESAWEVYVENGREPTGLDVVEWAKKVEDLGAGEIIITSIDQDGTKKGFDVKLNKLVASSVSIPVVASGGAGSNEHVLDLMLHSNVDAVALASLLHYEVSTIQKLKSLLIDRGCKVRR